MKYRKLPVEIEAFHYLGDLVYDEHGQVVPLWIIDALTNGVLFTKCGQLRIKTLEGTMRVTVGDYIIRGVKGELYACKPDIFHQTYEEVTPC